MTSSCSSTLKAPVFYTTGNTKVFELLRILQKNKVHMAVVVDEYGGTQGISGWTPSSPPGSGRHRSPSHG